MHKSSYVIEGLENGTAYAVAVTGAYGYLESSFSVVLTAVPTAPLTVPDAPTGVVVIGTDDGQVELRGNKTTVYDGLASDGVSSYQPSIPFEALDDTVWNQVYGVDNSLGDYWMKIEAE